ncbi:unnamed protein product [Bemisia tabaci]|uniref:Non-structural maintenance of chromosomes element 1 homolog n=1 Tax=Bemisia tabaci TaxID=7038 RepID=A0A9P0A9A9_BEMTA|nr:unnamed protein product [Bemisia tabaci]
MTQPSTNKFKMLDEMKYFVQILLARRQMTEDNAKTVFSKIVPQDYEFDQTLVHMSTHLQKQVDLKIAKTVCEITDNIYYSIVPCTYKKESFQLNLMKDAELVFFKKMILHILENHTGTIGDDAIEDFRVESGISRLAADNTIERLIETKYLMRVPITDEIAMAPLCIAEFTTFLKVNFSDRLNSCKLCNSITIKGVRCVSCDERIHKHCLSKFFEKLAARMRKCPSCGELWQNS